MLVAAPSTSEYVPTGQAVQTALPSAAYVPAGQMVHVPGSEAPMAAEAYPAAHKVHSPDSASSAYVPVRQGVQAVLPSAEYVPAGQVAHVLDELAATMAEDLPAVHFMHVALLTDSSTSEYVPAMQEVQFLLPSAEYVPATHTLHVSDVLAATAADALPAEHLAHVEFPVAPSVSE